jgi:hypothetical protein
MTEIKSIPSRLQHYLYTAESSAPTAVFRIIFGALMAFSIMRFWLKGWIYELYIQPNFYFPFFDWAKPLGNPGMYILFGLCGIFALGIAFGYRYRISAIGFFVTFTYIELLDKTNYLNHYYFVSLIALLLIFIPAHKRFSVDVRQGNVSRKDTFPRIFRLTIMLQLSVVYFFAGLAKLNSDWLLEAQPMAIWLKSFGHSPLVGSLFDTDWLPYVFAYFGAIFDLTIAFFLFSKRTRTFAYFFVVAFHVATYLLFPIGMFPFLMIGSNLIFFSPSFHEKILRLLGEHTITNSARTEMKKLKLGYALFLVYFAFQIIIPFRYLAYPGELFWNEQGFRFSWRVMLIEKTGLAYFYVKGEDMPYPLEVNNKDFLTINQEKMMSTQPDMIVQYAHHLKAHYESQGIKSPAVSAKIYVTLNGRSSRLFVDPDIDLSTQKDDFKPKEWILPLNEKIYGL